MDFIGIENHKEYFTQHYFCTIAKEDIDRQIDLWKEKCLEGELLPHKRLQQLDKPYFSFLGEYGGTLEERIALQRAFFRDFFSRLGFRIQTQCVPLDEGNVLPLLCSIHDENETPILWIIEGIQKPGDFIDPMDLMLMKEQYPCGDEEYKCPELTLEEIITKQICSEKTPPRWILVATADKIVLIDRTKWLGRGCSLIFDLKEIFERKEAPTIQALTVLLHKDSLVGTLHNEMMRNCHRHACGVSEDLKYSIRDSIEKLANEAVHYLRTERKEKVYETQLAEKLSKECLRYMYRLLFVLYLEARPELGYTPHNNEIYLKGYSFEVLRELELTPLHTEEAQNGYFFHESISLLFSMIQQGTGTAQSPDLFCYQSVHNTFSLSPLSSKLFDPCNTPTLNKVKFRNKVLQEVIVALSLSHVNDKKMGRGRISYSSLSINELGSVYESLLSFNGFFAETDLYEVKKGDEKFNALNPRYFVEEHELPSYKDEERFDHKGNLVKHPKGSFIYCLSGRDRQQSASYYTPQCLTQFLVKRALDLLIKDKSADELLKLTICEPAMGSGAFLNEAVNQIAEAYLQKKQKETGKRIPSESYVVEKQKVKMLLADGNIFGVDLNSTAVELAEVSLWLNSIYKGAHVPWFGMQLAHGNSLVGARREVVSLSHLQLDKTLTSAPRERLPLSEQRSNDAIYHFLLPAKKMADYQGKDIKALIPEAFVHLKKWRKEFFSPLGMNEIALLKRLSAAIDRLWATHAGELRILRERLNYKTSIFGCDIDYRAPDPLGEKEKKWNEYLSNPIGAYRKLKLAMDYWCALWYWPLSEAGKLPTRKEWLNHLSLILLGEAEAGLFDEGLKAVLKQTAETLSGTLDVQTAEEQLPQLGIVSQVAQQHAFFHWELHFADILSNGGFDLIIGNPPWVKLSWEEKDFLAEKNPQLVLHETSASDVAKGRVSLLKDFKQTEEFLTAYEGIDGTQRMLNAIENWPLMKGCSSNLYKFFIEKSWSIGHRKGISALIHENGIYEDTKGGLFRSHIYRRLEHFYHFKNNLKLFDVGADKIYGANIYRNVPKEAVKFTTIANLFHPDTVDESEQHDGYGEVSGIKTAENSWSLEGHRDRIITVAEQELAVFAALYDETETPPIEAKLPMLHATQFLNTLEKIARYPLRMGDLGDQATTTAFWHETGAQKEGTIRRETSFCGDPEKVIFSSPHFTVGNPYSKTARAICKEKSDYDTIDLLEIPEAYLPRTNYLPDVSDEEYAKRVTKAAWDKTLCANKTYKVIFRGMLNLNSERTLQAAIALVGSTHIHGCQSTSFQRLDNLLAYASFCQSLPVDFFVKISGKTNALPAFLKQLPLLKDASPYQSALFARTLRLNCLTKYYAGLWEQGWSDSYLDERWSKEDPRLQKVCFSKLTPHYQRESALRTDYARRQALVEIDLLAAMEFGLTLDELLTLYRIQFPILQQNEQTTWYDQNGRIAYTENRSLYGVGLPKAKWKEVKDYPEGQVSHTFVDDTMPGGKREKSILFCAPFDRCSREEDYRQGWAYFSKKYGNKEG